jgi:hypothetical protein
MELFLDVSTEQESLEMSRSRWGPGRRTDTPDSAQRELPIQSLASPSQRKAAIPGKKK